MILGEPGKATNSISTDPKNRMIIADKEGQVLRKPYHDQTGKSSNICRVQESRMTIYPGEDIELEVPDYLQNTEVVLTPRREFADIFEPRIMYVNEIIKVKNVSTLPVTLRRHNQIVDLQGTSWKEIEERKEVAKVNLVHDHDDDRFIFRPVTKKVEPPELEKIQVDPQNQLSKEAREQFKHINKQFEHLFTTTPGRYMGYYGDVDTTLQFIQTPVQTHKVAVPNYSPEMKLQMANKMDELIEAGILMTPEEVGVSVEFISPSLLVPKTEKDSWRLVTDFTSLNKFVKRCASSNPTIEEARKDLAKKKFFCKIDLSNYFFQGELRRKDYAYLGIQHPFKGIFIYTASPQGPKKFLRIQL